MEEQRLPGGNASGAVLASGTVRRPAWPWTPAVHAVLRHLEARGFDGAPRVLGMDERGREKLTFLPGQTVGTARPWPAWVHSDGTLGQVGRWLRRYHDAVADFVPPPGLRWRTSPRARDVAAAEGFTHFAERPRRLSLLLDAYGYAGTVGTVLAAVRSRIDDHARGLRELAAAGDPLFARLVRDGVIDGLDRAMAELARDAATFMEAGSAPARHREWHT